MSRFTTALLAAPLCGLFACSPQAPGPTAMDDLALDRTTMEGGSVGAAVRTTWPSPEDPGAPFYARIEPAPPHVLHDGEWAAVAFYRDPACVRPDFNLLTFFDPPAAFGCAAVVSGASIWDNGPGVGAPRVAVQNGDAVPIWFFPVGALLAALEDGMLTIGELAAVPGRLVGTATHFTEALHPHGLPPALGGGGHPRPGLTISAQGRLEDGRSFQFQYRSDDGGVRSVRIRFR
jgi:hypothetical protein